MNKSEKPYYHIWNSLLAEPAEFLVRTQIRLLYQRRGLRFIEQKQWDNLTEAVVVLEKCLKLMNSKEEK